MQVPLYLDWTFWAVVVAALALVLSQLPPIYQLVRRAKLGIEIYTRAHLTHKIGNPNVQLHIILSNAGGRSVPVRGVALAIRRDGKDIAVLPAQNYLQDPNSERTVLFTRFSLKPREEWAYIVNFLNYFSRTDEKKYRAAELALKNDIMSKRQLAENKDTLVEADHAYVEPLIAMFNDKFIWQPGEYQIRIAVDAVPRRAGLEKTYRFTLFESDSAEFTAAKDDFRTGDGIYWNSGNHPGVLVQLVEA